MILPDNAGATVFILTADRPALLPFYTQTLGLRLLSEDGFGAVLAAPGFTLRLTDVADYQPSAHPVLCWDVPDLAASVRALAAKGVACEVYPGFGQDDMGIWTSEDGATRLVWFKDSEGTLLMLAQRG
jgi:catechol 2,3-dioxygenase-like lactoylglutathione lyase family enzyme